MIEGAGHKARYKVGHIPLLLASTSLLAACDENRGSDSAESASQPTEITTAEDDSEARYREKVKRRVSASIVSSFSREWGVAESAVECVLADVGVNELDDVSTDASVAAVFEKCGVDPSIVK